MNTKATNMVTMLDRLSNFLPSIREDNEQPGVMLAYTSGQQPYNGLQPYAYWATGPGYELGVMRAWEEDLNSHGWYTEWVNEEVVRIYPL
jgi:hypothetical protein